MNGIEPTRLARAVWLKCETLGGEAYLVTSDSSGHLVSELGCDCVDRRIRGPNCKHEIAVRLHALDDEIKTALRVLIPAPHWPAVHSKEGVAR